jgi:hypothetical protein
VPSGQFEPPGPPDPRLDPYRGGIARVHDGPRLIGHLVTRVQTWWTVEGPFWRRRYVEPTEVIDWLLSYSDPDDGFLDDSISETALAEELQDWDAGRWIVNDQAVRLEWLHGPEAEEARRRNSWP